MTPSASARAPQSPPVHQHRDWRHLQRAAIAAYPRLANVTQVHFCALMMPAASIAVWILQHAPHLAQREQLNLLVAQATEYEALDSGRWLQFIPWLLGRPAMRLGVTLVSAVPFLPGAAANDGADPDTDAALDLGLRSHFYAAVRDKAPARLYQGTVAGALAAVDSSPSALPDLCTIFSPQLSANHPSVVSEQGVLPLLRAQVPMALFSASEAEQLVDVYTLEAAGLLPRDAECWPNPWALPTPNAERVCVHGKMGWAAEFDEVPADASAQPAAMRALAHAFDCVERSTTEFGVDAILTLGEPLHVAPGAGTDPDASTGLLLRLPHGVAVDVSNGYIYQLQDAVALLLEGVPSVPAAVFESFPGHDALLQRAIWAVGVHEAHVQPYAQPIDDALMSQFSALDAVAG